MDRSNTESYQSQHNTGIKHIDTFNTYIYKDKLIVSSHSKKYSACYTDKILNIRQENPRNNYIDCKVYTNEYIKQVAFSEDDNFLVVVCCSLKGNRFYVYKRVHNDTSHMWQFHEKCLCGSIDSRDTVIHAAINSNGCVALCVRQCSGIGDSILCIYTMRMQLHDCIILDECEKYIYWHDTEEIYTYNKNFLLARIRAVNI